MESLARRGVRTTVAVAGFAALGVGLAAPAFAAPSVPEVSGVGSSPTAGQQDGAAKAFTKASDAMTRLPGLFQFEAPSTDEPTPIDAAATDAESPSTRSAPSDSTDSTDSTESTESTESTDSATTPETAAAPTQPATGVLPSIPGSPVGAQANPQVSGLPTDSALQSLDAGSLF